MREVFKRCVVVTTVSVLLSLWFGWLFHEVAKRPQFAVSRHEQVATVDHVSLVGFVAVATLPNDWVILGHEP